MAASLLYCGGCDAILAAAPELDLSARCVSHVVDDDLHEGYVALRLSDVDLSSADLTDLSTLAARFPKGAHTAQLEPLAGRCA